VLFALLAALPLLILFVMLAVLRLPGLLARYPLLLRWLSRPNCSATVLPAGTTSTPGRSASPRL
jgi:hypothetical protein